MGDRSRKSFWVLLTLATRVTAPMCAESTGSSESVSGLEEIVVTAQKREENLQSVPVTVTALSSAMLERQGIAAFTDLPRVVPALTIKAARNFPTSSISLRGIGTFAFSIGIEPSVSVVVDDVAVALQSQAYNYLNDIERIEVLEGPQGTLFGKNASAGVVNIVTKDPSPAWSGSLRQGFAQTSELRTDASLSGPLGARAGIRLSGYVQSSGGYVADLTNGLRLNNSDGGGVRGKLRLAVTDHLEIMLSADHNSATSRGTARTYRSLPADAQLFGVIPVAGFASGIAPGPRNFSVRLDSIPRNNSDQSTWALKAALDLGRQRLTAISSDQRWHYFNNQDIDGSDADVLGALIGGAAHGGVSQSGPTVMHQHASELRLTSTVDAPFEYLAGLFESDIHTFRHTAEGPVLMVGSFDAAINTRSSAVFAQASYRLTDLTKLTGGIRLNHQMTAVTMTNLVPVVPVSYSGHDGESKVTGKLSLQRNVASQWMMFMSVSTGYKGEAYDVSLPVSRAKASTPVKAETSVSYELGVKSRMLDDRLQLNGTAFLTDYRDFQAQSSVVNPTTLELDAVLANVGRLRTQGIEADAQWQAAGGWRMGASAAYIDATIRSFPNAACFPGQTAAQGCHYAGVGPTTNTVQDLRGHSLSNAPRLKFSLNNSYEGRALGGRLVPFLDVNFEWQDKVDFDLYGDPGQVQGAYGLVNVSIGLKSNSKSRVSYSASLFVKNVFDKAYSSALDDEGDFFTGSPPGSVILQVLPRDSQRYFGVRLGASL